VIELEIEFDVANSGHPRVPVYVNGEGPFTFTLDTGASTTTISKSLANKLGIETSELENTKASEVNSGQIAVETTNVESFTVGSETYENLEVMVLDLDSVFESYESCNCGVIGHSTLKNYRVSVDYRTKLLKFEQKNEENPSEDDEIDWINFEYIVDHLVGVPVNINGKGPFDFVLDTGSGGDALTPKLAEELGFSPEQAMGLVKVVNPAKQGSADGRKEEGGEVTGYPIQVDSLSIGSIKHNNAIMIVIDLNLISPRGDTIQDGIICYPFMKNLELIIDYPNKRLAFIE
jgi:clan AA aspartic protease (TIGR02281 family)